MTSTSIAIQSAAVVTRGSTLRTLLHVKMGERKVFIAVDGSKPSDLAFNWYLDNMNRQGDLVYLVHAAEYNVSTGLPGAAADVEAITKAVKEENDRIENMTGGYMEGLKKRSIQGILLQLPSSGKPGEAIIEAAVKESPAAIVMGSRGLGKIRRTLLGSVSEYVTHHAPARCAVTVVRDS